MTIKDGPLVLTAHTRMGGPRRPLGSRGNYDPGNYDSLAAEGTTTHRGTTTQGTTTHRELRRELRLARL